MTAEIEVHKFLHCLVVSIKPELVVETSFWWQHPLDR